MPTFFLDNPSPVDFISDRLNDSLTGSDMLTVLTNGLPPFAVIIGVPHQARIGQNYIAEESLTGRRPSDEGTAFFALETFRLLCLQNLPGKLIVMSHDTRCDPNKDRNSAYWQAVFNSGDPFCLLLECHGASPDRKFDIEVTAGRNHHSDALGFGRLLVKTLDYGYSLAAQIEHGRDMAMQLTRRSEIPARLRLPALQTSSLIYAAEIGVPALHVEAKPCFRIPGAGGDRLSHDGATLGRALAQAIIQYLENNGIIG